MERTPNRRRSQIKFQPSSNDDNGRLHRRKIEFLTIKDLLKYEPPSGFELVGDSHIQMGGQMFVVGGPPGVGKSRALEQLAIVGAMGTGSRWLGYLVKRKFKTLIIQNENGKIRLQRDLKRIPGIENLDEWIRITSPPINGFEFDNKEFREEIRKMIEEFQPDLIVIDPWTDVVADLGQKEYREAFHWIRTLVPQIDTSPAIGIVAHTRKPRPEERKLEGRALLPMLAGSYMLTSVPRCVFLMMPAFPEEVENDQILFSCIKNNDGPLGKREAWKPDKTTGLYILVTDFKWDELKRANKGGAFQQAITKDDLHEVFNRLEKEWLLRSVIVCELMKMGEQKRIPVGTIYRAIDPEGGYLSKYLAYRGKGKGMAMKWGGSEI